MDIVTRVKLILLLACFIGIVGGIASFYEKKHGKIPFWTLIPVILFFWAAAVLFFWGDIWMVLVSSVIFVALLVLAILKCLKKF